MRNLILVTLLSVATMPCGFAQSSAPEPKVMAAVDGVLEAFTAYPVVALGDSHGMAQEEDFYAALVRSPRFATEVGNVVVEFGDAAQQHTLDRYLSGEEIPYPELRKVWADTVGWLPTVTSLGYINFYAQVREVNRKLQPEQQIHVWLGDPAVDWAQVKTEADLPKESRDQVPAEILKKLLEKHKRALLIYGMGHFYGPDSIKARVEQQYPNAVFLIHPYSGFQEEVCSTAFETLAQSWGRNSLISPVRGSSLEAQAEDGGLSRFAAQSWDLPAWLHRRAEGPLGSDDGRATVWSGRRCSALPGTRRNTDPVTRIAGSLHGCCFPQGDRSAGRDYVRTITDGHASEYHSNESTLC